ncbi:MAG: hypothetical protein ACR2MP_00315 [Streptosporangiaceae bacterium]
MSELITKTYSQLSAGPLAQPGSTALAGLVQTVFRGRAPGAVTT